MKISKLKKNNIKAPYPASISKNVRTQRYIPKM